MLQPQQLPKEYGEGKENEPSALSTVGMGGSCMQNDLPHDEDGIFRESEVQNATGSLLRTQESKRLRGSWLQPCKLHEGQVFWE